MKMHYPLSLVGYEQTRTCYRWNDGMESGQS